MRPWAGQRGADPCDVDSAVRADSQLAATNVACGHRRSSLAVDSYRLREFSAVVPRYHIVQVTLLRIAREVEQVNDAVIVDNLRLNPGIWDPHEIY